MASTVALRADSCCINSGFWAGQMKSMSVVPSRISATSSLLGGRTLKTMSEAAHSAAAPNDLGPGGAVGVVAEIGGIPRPRLHSDGEAQLDQLLHHIGHGGHALFAGEGFPRHADTLRLRVWACLHQRSPQVS
jgi:hypothetical protein